MPLIRSSSWSTSRLSPTLGSTSRALLKTSRSANSFRTHLTQNSGPRLLKTSTTIALLGHLALLLTTAPCMLVPQTLLMMELLLRAVTALILTGKSHSLMMLTQTLIASRTPRKPVTLLARRSSASHRGACRLVMRSTSNSALPRLCPIR